jgi:hypothetical protein
MRKPTLRQTLSMTGAAAALSVTVITSVHAGNLYRWTDANGQRHMESIIPADQAKLGYEVVDDRTFRVLKTVGRALNEEELAAAEKAQAIEKQKNLEQQRAARHDRTLLATYMSVDDMQMARNGQLGTLELMIESTRRTRERLKTNLDDLIGSAAAFERDGKPVPKRTEKAIANVRQQIELQTEIINENREKQRLIAAQFDADISRFKTLKGIVDPATPVDNGVSDAAAKAAAEARPDLGPKTDPLPTQ